MNAMVLSMWHAAHGPLVLNRGTYGLGKGGREPGGLPFNSKGQCDCSGFACWLVGIDRLQVYDGEEYWYSTDGIIRDATGPQREFRVVKRTEPVQVGDFVVYGDKDGRQGHIMWIASVLPGFATARRAGKGWGSRLLVIDCSPTSAARPWAIQYRPDRAAPAERSGRAYFVRAVGA